MQGKLPVTVFTGFLGAGKTTLLSNLILSEPDINFAVVVNEFGIVSVDDILVQRAFKLEASGSQIFKLGGGLIAYEVDDFLQTMLEIASSKNRFDHVLIETSGLAVPTAVIEALNHEELVKHFVLDATLALLDTPLFVKDSGSNEALTDVFRSQVLASDVVVLNKIEGLSAQTLEQAEGKVRSLAPQVRFIEPAWQAKLDSRLCLGLHLNEFRALEHVPGVSSLSSVHSHSLVDTDGHSHTGLGAHQHGLNTHEHLHEQDPSWMSFCLTSHLPQNRRIVEEALALIASRLPLFRVKGFVHCQGFSEHLLIQGVREKIISTVKERELELAMSHSHSHGHSHSHSHDHAPESAPELAPRNQSQLVFIGYELERSATVALLSKYTDSPWF